jgi:hypothetical protein
MPLHLVGMEQGWDEELLSDALDVLGDLPQWRLPAPRWEQVGPILDRIERAFAEGDNDGLRFATTDLEIHGPVRANRIGTKDPQGPDQSLLERQNHLVHEIGKARPAPAEGGTQRPDGGRGDRSAR